MSTIPQGARFYRLVGWAEFQHYKDRNPPWIKLHRSMLDSETWVCASDAVKVLAVASMLLAAITDNRIPLNFEYIARKGGLRDDRGLPLTGESICTNLSTLYRFQFIEFTDEEGNTLKLASTFLADASNLHTNARPETEAQKLSQKPAEERERGQAHVELKLDGGTEPPPDPVEVVFQHWAKVRNKRHPKLTRDRRRAIAGRLVEGYPVAQLKRACDGIAFSQHHMGKNDTGTVYDDVELICRNGKNVEKFSALAEQFADKPEQVAQLSAVGQRAVANGNVWLEQYGEQSHAAK